MGYEYGDLDGMPDDIAREVASAWHGGQRFPLYAFASTGTVRAGILGEVDDCIASLEGDRAINTESLQRELRALRNYLAPRVAALGDASDSLRETARGL